MVPNVEKMLINTCKQNRGYEYLHIGWQGNEDLFVLSSRLLLEDGSELKFEVDISVNMIYQTVDFTVPVFPYNQGFYGPKVGGFYQLMGELSSMIRGNAKLVPFSPDNTNQPVIILSREFFEITERRFRKDISYLRDTFLFVYFQLELARTGLRLRLADDARNRSPFSSFIDGVFLLGSGDNSDKSDEDEI